MIAVMHDIEAIKSWVEALSSSDEHIRRQASEALLLVGDAAIVPLLGALRANNDIQSIEAVRLLATFRDDGRVFEAMVLLLYTGNTLAALYAAEYLGHCGTIGVEPLLNALEGARYMVQLAIVQSLERIGDRRAVVPLMNLLTTHSSQSSVLRYTIIQALGILGDPQALELIRTFRNDEDHHVRKRTQTALRHLGDFSEPN